ncbi:MAG: hypothetical protein OXC48_02585, partial [Endozoicomonadaceae bacterium]|nr:hypothetical protein [Endozoicomonadaceae bacterium]
MLCACHDTILFPLSLAAHIFNNKASVDTSVFLTDEKTLLLRLIFLRMNFQVLYILNQINVSYGILLIV